MNYVLVAVGGACGSVMRYALSLRLEGLSGRFPLATFLANLFGCLLIGAYLAWSEQQPSLDPRYRLLFVTGILGGFTTFSAFGLESLNLLRSGALSLAVSYVGTSLAAALCGTYLGFLLTKTCFSGS